MSGGARFESLRANAIRSGEVARREDVPRSFNPYDEKEHQSLAPYWDLGWQQADTEIRKKETKL